MSTYQFEALDGHGKTQKGTLDADSPKDARNQIKDRGLIPLKVQASSKPASSRVSFLSNKGEMSKQDLAVWTRQLASLISAGLQVDKALDSLVEQTDSPKVQALMREVIGQVKAGQSLSMALGAFASTFDGVYCSVVAAGEKAGTLGLVLTSLADDLEAAQVLKAKIVGAALYPAIVSAIAVLIVAFLMVSVLPQVAGSFSTSKRALPLLTVVMLGISTFLKQWWALLVVALAAAVCGAKLGLKNPQFKLRVHLMMLTLPVVGKLVKSYNAARFSGTLGMLVSAGVPLLSALHSATKTVSNDAMRQEAEHVTVMVNEGAQFGLALAQKKTFPKIVSTFAGMGEKTGAMGPMLTKVSSQLSAEVQRRALSLASVLEPMLIVAMGGVVMMIVLAVLMPIIEMNSFVN